MAGPIGRLPRVVVALGLLLLGTTPALAALSQRHLNESAAAFVRGDCTKAIDSALDSINVLGLRPEPWEILGYCDVRSGEERLAVRALEKAVERDPEHWHYRYGLALARGAAGQDPRPDARAALRLNPHNPLLQEAVKRFDTDDRREWRRRALAARLPRD